LEVEKTIGSFEYFPRLAVAGNGEGLRNRYRAKSGQ